MRKVMMVAALVAVAACGDKKADDMVDSMTVVVPSADSIRLADSMRVADSMRMADSMHMADSMNMMKP
ncbi:MAG: hypothetical protein H0W15_06640 [Gemmatimonadales bacterium]|nr:hypothetical protein [Gemmatimonadales bacterium]